MAKKKDKKRHNLLLPISVLVIIIILAVAYIYQKENEKQRTNSNVFFVNDEVLAKEEIDIQYNQLPEVFKSTMSREAFIEQMILYKLLLQEARLSLITVSDAELNEKVNSLKQGITNEKFSRFLKERNIAENKFREDIREQIMIDKLLSTKIYSDIEVSGKEVKNFYNGNRESFIINNKTIEFDKIKMNIKSALIEEKRNVALNTYFAQLKSKAIISNETPISFKSTNNDICKIDNKPVIRFNSVSTCKPCKWIEGAFNNAIKPLLDNNEVIAYHWELDTGDNLLTEQLEGSIPKAEKDIFLKYSPESAVPAFIFGCRYYRIGNGIGTNLRLKEKEFEIVTKKLLS